MVSGLLLWLAHLLAVSGFGRSASERVTGNGEMVAIYPRLIEGVHILGLKANEDHTTTVIERSNLLFSERNITNEIDGSSGGGRPVAPRPSQSQSRLAVSVVGGRELPNQCVGRCRAGVVQLY